MSDDPKPFLHRYGIVISLIALTVVQLPTTVMTSLSLYRNSSGPSVSVEGAYDRMYPPPFEPVPGGDVHADMLKELQKFRVCINLSIRNAGNRPAEDLRIRLNGEGSSSIRREGESESIGTFSNEVEIGRVRVAEAVSVRLWLYQDYSPTTDTILVTHDLGQSEAVMTGTPGSPLNDYWKGFYRALPAVMIGTTFAVILAQIVAQLAGLRRDRRRRQIADLAEGRTDRE